MSLDWRLKIATKMILSRTPVPYALWKRLGLFVNGPAENLGYSRSVFEKHLNRVRPSLEPLEGFVSVELGPGDSVMTALVAKACGGRRTYLVDVSAFAVTDVEPYRLAAEALRAEGLAAPDLADAKTLDDVLAACDATYLTDGLASLRTIGDGEADFVWSHAVLQQIRLKEFDATLAEFRRITRPGGMHSHVVDLRDLLQEGLNNLRFSEGLWESGLMANSGFYTNRIRCLGLLERFRTAGFEPRVLTANRWARPPLPRSALAPEFRDLDEDDLSIQSVDFIAKRL